MTKTTHTVSSAADRLQDASAKPVLRVWLDVVCPFCLLAKAPMMEAIKGLEIEVEYMPYELRPYPAPTLLPEDPYLPAIWRRAVYPLAERLGVPIKLPTISPQPYTRLAFEGYQFAKEQNKGTEYIDAVMAAFFKHDRDIGQIAVLEDIAAGVGLSAAAFRAALENGTYTDKHTSALEAAAKHEVRVVPSFAVGNRRFDGTPDWRELRAAIEAEIHESS